jgi:hypothetical protein
VNLNSNDNATLDVNLYVDDDVNENGLYPSDTNDTFKYY